MQSNITQCPACASTFNVNSQMLEAAAGRVRCGACLNVFEATENFLNDDHDASIHSDTESVFVSNASQEYHDPSSFLTRSALTETTNLQADSDHSRRGQNPVRKPEQAETLSENFFVTVAKKLQERDERQDSLDNTKNANESSLETDAGHESDTVEEPTETIRARALEAILQDEEALETIPQENLATLGEMSAAVELAEKRESRLLQKAALLLAILLLGTLLSAQYLLQRVALYSQLAALRPLYEFTCTYLNCELAEYADIHAIRSDNLTVRSHPVTNNSLMVNTTIRNTAAFPQAFPILILSFNSAANSVIALREFAATEYLDPRLHTFNSMPVMTPVQINLAIMDPGVEAVNYTLAFRLP